MEDGLALWHTVLQHSPDTAYTQELHALYPNAAAAVSRDFGEGGSVLRVG